MTDFGNKKAMMDEAFVSQLPQSTDAELNEFLNVIAEHEQRMSKILNLKGRNDVSHSEMSALTFSMTTPVVIAIMSEVKKRQETRPKASASQSYKPS